jgi:hypothetical protein
MKYRISLGKDKKWHVYLNGLLSEFEVATDSYHNRIKDALKRRGELMKKIVLLACFIFAGVVSAQTMEILVTKEIQVTQEVWVTQEVTAIQTTTEAASVGAGGTNDVSVKPVMTTTQETTTKVWVEKCDLCAGNELPYGLPNYLLPMGYHDADYDICHRCCEKLLFKTLKPMLATMGVVHKATREVINGPGR